jgi:ABC-type microcin C transport system permease subunit YejE
VTVKMKTFHINLMKSIRTFTMYLSLKMDLKNSSKWLIKVLRQCKMNLQYSYVDLPKITKMTFKFNLSKQKIKKKNSLSFDFDCMV